ncbi:MAG: hypothetical protein AAB708_01415 [Patescibacteria group bacterium]
MNLFEKIFRESVVAFLLVVFLCWFINPFDFWMNDAFHMTLLGLVVALFAIFSMFLWKERVSDEREELHKYIATRFAYTTAGGLLLLATIVQAFSHTLDPWLPTVLAGMVLAKIIGRWYAEKKY